jgi:hypothetical protein
MWVPELSQDPLAVRYLSAAAPGKDHNYAQISVLLAWHLQVDS